MAPNRPPQKSATRGHEMSALSSRIQKKDTSEVKEPTRQAITRTCGKRQTKFNDVDVITGGSNGRLSRDTVTVVHNVAIHGRHWCSKFNYVYSYLRRKQTQEWMLAIAPQSKAGLLILPLELRHKIYRYYLDLYTKTTISPEKRGQNFVAVRLGWVITRKYGILLLVSRQFYAGTVFFLYQEAAFRLKSLTLLGQYLAFINPIKTAMISELQLDLNAPAKTSPFQPSLFQMLSDLSSLKTLTIKVVARTTICDLLYCESRVFGLVRTWRIKDSYLEAWKSENWNTLQSLELFSKLSVNITVRAINGWGAEIRLQEHDVLSFADEVLKIWALGRYKVDEGKKDEADEMHAA